MTLGQNVKTYREKNGLTQTELAVRIQASQPYVSQLENDLFIPSAQVLLILSKLLEVSIDELLKDKRKVI